MTLPHLGATGLNTRRDLRGLREQRPGSPGRCGFEPRRCGPFTMRTPKERQEMRVKLISIGLELWGRGSAVKHQHLLAQLVVLYKPRRYQPGTKAWDRLDKPAQRAVAAARSWLQGGPPPDRRWRRYLHTR